MSVTDKIKVGHNHNHFETNRQWLIVSLEVWIDRQLQRNFSRKNDRLAISEQISKILAVDKKLGLQYLRSNILCLVNWNIKRIS